MASADPYVMLSCAALGALALWIRLKYGSNIQGSFDQLIDDLWDDFCLRVFVKLVIFVAFGAILSVLMVEPTTAKQALAAGMAWTTLLGGLAETTKKKAKPNA